MRYWSTLRPISIGTYPREYGVIQICNFDTKRRVEEIGRPAFGYIDFVDELPRDVQQHYDLWPEVTVPEPLARIARVYRKAIERGDYSRIAKCIERAYQLDLIDSEDELAEAARMVTEND